MRIIAAFAAVLLCLFVSFPHADAADNLRLQEDKIKAGLLYNFLKYTTWPAATFSDNTQAFHVCLVGDNSLGDALAPMEGRTAQQRPIRIQTMYKYDRLVDCHVVYIDKGHEASMSQAVNVIQGYPILIVSDINGFASQGGMVELSKSADKRIHLHINNQSIKNAGLYVGEPLLKLSEDRHQ